MGSSCTKSNAVYPTRVIPIRPIEDGIQDLAAVQQSNNLELHSYNSQVSINQHSPLHQQQSTLQLEDLSETQQDETGSTVSSKKRTYGRPSTVRIRQYYEGCLTLQFRPGIDFPLLVYTIGSRSLSIRNLQLVIDEYPPNDIVMAVMMMKNIERILKERYQAQGDTICKCINI